MAYKRGQPLINFSPLFRLASHLFFYCIAFPIAMTVCKVMYGARAENKHKILRWKGGGGGAPHGGGVPLRGGAPHGGGVPLRGGAPHGGAILVSNHTCPLDPVMVTGVLWHRLTYQTLLEKTVETPFLGTLTRLLGGVPLPRGMSGVQKVLQTVPDAFRYRPFFHFYPEGECYMYNQQIQPFKPGAFYIAAKLNVPVIPIVNIHSEGRGKCVQSERRTRRCRPRKRPFMTWSVLDPLYPADYVHRGANSMPSADCAPSADSAPSVDGEPDADGVRAFAEAVRAAMQKAIDAKNEEDPRYGTQKFYKGKMPRLKGINE